MKKIKINNTNLYAIVDDEDFEYLNQFTWCLDREYARRIIYINENSKRKQRCIRMHREILNAPADKIIDHINGNGLDNRKENLRYCTKSTNAMNCKIHKHNTSGYKGVSKSGNRWRAYIVLNDKQRQIGSYKTKEEAALAYNKKAIELFGEFAKLNDVKLRKRQNETKKT